MNENEVIGIDLYNQSITGGVAKTLNNRATDSDHLPCVIVRCATLKISGGVRNRPVRQESRERSVSTMGTERYARSFSRPNADSVE